MTQAEVAESAGVTTTYVYRLERGKYVPGRRYGESVVYSPTMHKIADALGWKGSIDELLRDDGVDRL